MSLCLMFKSLLNEDYNSHHMESLLYQLYYFPLNASMAPHFILEELNVDFELIIVDRKSNAQKSPDYLAINPVSYTHLTLPTIYSV